jgi:hypothetical protein
MKLNEISAVVNKANEAIKANEKLPVPVLAAKASRAAQENPEDVSLITASQVLNKMASKQTWITRAEFNKIHDSLYNTQTKLAEVFAEELDRQPLARPKVFERSPDEGIGLERDYERVADPLLANALSAALDGSNQEKLYSPQDAKAAQRSCQAELLGLGLEPKRVETFAGRNDFIICNAVYETPRGQSHVLVPIEMKQGKALLPNMFLSEQGFVDLSAEALSDHIKNTAGSSYRVDGQKLLEVLSTAKSGIKKIASDVEMAAMKVRAAKESPAHDPNSIIYQKIDDPSVSELEVEAAPVEPEHVKLSHRLVSPEGAAQFIFSPRTVEAGRQMLIRKMVSFGYSNAQVRVADADDESIIYAVAVGTQAGIKVPVKVSGDKVLPATVIIAGEQLSPFSKEGVDEVVKGGAGDSRMLAMASPSHGLTPNELVQRVKDAVAEGNFPKAEDAINVLGDVDKQAQKVAIAIMMQSLSGDNETPVAKTASQQVHDTPQFMTHKIFFPEGA